MVIALLKLREHTTFNNINQPSTTLPESTSFRSSWRKAIYTFQKPNSYARDLGKEKNM